MNTAPHKKYLFSVSSIIRGLIHLIVYILHSLIFNGYGNTFLVVKNQYKQVIYEFQMLPYPAVILQIIHLGNNHFLSWQHLFCVLSWLDWLLWATVQLCVLRRDYTVKGQNFSGK